MLPAFAVMAVLGVMALLLAASAVRRQPTVSMGAEPTMTASAAPTDTGVPLRNPTPSFATYRSLTLRLPIDPGDVTVLAFHQASGKEALHMTSLVRDADMTLAATNKAVPASTLTSTSTAASSTVETIWSGTALRLWRSNRSGEPDTAVDVGAEPGTDVYAPVTGTVVQVREYSLYNKFPDYEIHIHPDGWSDIDVVLIHVDDLSVTVGQRVAGGISRLAAVRRMSDKIDLQLGGYTKNGGDHVHLQLNKIEVPGRLERLGGS